MTLRTKRPHLACYDISDPKRLNRVHRYLKKIGIPLQYSVFLLHVEPIKLGRITAGLDRLINPHEDDVRIYPLPQRPDWQWWGKPNWMDGIVLSGVTLPEGLTGARFKDDESH
ncbi:MAG: hypothetical protein Kow0060_18990 [Methylohalobius crimeensis]